MSSGESSTLIPSHPVEAAIPGTIPKWSHMTRRLIGTTDGDTRWRQPVETTDGERLSRAAKHTGYIP